MPSVLYGAGTFERSNGNFPPLTTVNMFLEQGVQTSEQNMALLSRAGLGQLSTPGTGPINGIFPEVEGYIYCISNTTLYQNTTSLGSVAGSGHASWATSTIGGEILVTRGSTMRGWNGTNLVDVSPGGFTTKAVCFIGSLFVAAVNGVIKGQFFWSDPLDGRTFDALNYATAEREGDDLEDIKPLGDNIWLFGTRSVEAWAHTGEANLPFTRLENVAYSMGIFGTGAVTPADNSLIFVGNDRCVYRIAESPQRISDHSIEERILNSATCTLFTFKREGHEFVCVRLATESLIYDCSTGQWTEFQTNGGQWVVKCGAMLNQAGYFGHESTNQIMGWDEWDDLGVNLERIFTAVVPLDTPQSVNSLKLWANTGHTPITGGGAGTNPTVSMRFSRDAGNTWSSWESTSLGAQTEYRVIAEWRALGMFDFPGAMFQFKTSDPIPFRVSKVAVNDPGGGRSR